MPAGFGQIFFVLIKNLPPKVKRMLSKFDRSDGMPRNVVKLQRMGILTRRSADASELKKANLPNSPAVPFLPLKTRASFRRKFTRTAPWLLIIAYTM